jgi:hypothetical protein
MNGLENDTMNKDEMIKLAIEKYVNIQRAKKYGEQELNYQEKIAKAELQALGIHTEDLDIE